MTVYKIGSTGDEVRHIQQKLQGLGIYRGLLDGVFGGGAVHGIPYDLEGQFGIGLR